MARREQAAYTDYEGFVEKFKPKKTTDDCYTPPALYAAVRDWAAAERLAIDLTDRDRAVLAGLDAGAGGEG